MCLSWLVAFVGIDVVVLPGFVNLHGLSFVAPFIFSSCVGYLILKIVS